jgi:hypothetical protein
MRAFDDSSVKASCGLTEYCVAGVVRNKMGCEGTVAARGAAGGGGMLWGGDFLEVYGWLLFIVRSNIGLWISAKVSFIWSFFLLRSYQWNRSSVFRRRTFLFICNISIVSSIVLYVHVLDISRICLLFPMSWICSLYREGIIVCSDVILVIRWWTVPNEIQSSHVQLQWTHVLPVRWRPFEECADVAPDKFTKCTNLLLILYHYNNIVWNLI